MGWWNRLRAAVVDWLDFQPKPVDYKMVTQAAILDKDWIKRPEPDRPITYSDVVREIEKFGGWEPKPFKVWEDSRGIFFDLFPDDPEEAARLQAKSDRKIQGRLKRSRKPSKAKALKKDTPVAKKAKKLTKAHTKRSKATPKGRNRK